MSELRDRPYLGVIVVSDTIGDKNITYLIFIPDELF